MRTARDRLAAAGYRVDLKDPLTLTPEEQRALLALGPEPEPGFAMTLGRLFDPRDIGLLIGVCHDASGTPVAFNQYVPTPTIGGFSLDATRGAGEPAGLTDFIIVETIAWLEAQGHRSLGLNFVRVVNPVNVADNRGPWHSERRALHHAAGGPGLSLTWPFDRAPGFRWRPRYAVSDTMLGRSRASVAITREESLLTAAP
jgi:lysylphosphatidylglycerol synthetase-like protein (DUF2156 family)